MMQMRAAQKGATLIVSLVFLLVFLVMALSIFRGALTSAQAIGNMQWRNEAISAANETIDALLSESRVATDTANLTQEVNAAPFGYDVNGDNAADIRVSFPPVTIDVNGVASTRAGPRCLRIRPIPPSELSPSRPQDAGCFASSSAGGIAVASGGGATPATGSPSLCANTEWTMTVRATDPSTSTSVDVVQGFAVRVPTVSVPVCD
jgi:type II secretory pathway pseudopilin PulG